MPNLILKDFNPDWGLLKDQKETLINVMENGDSIIEDKLEGILNFIDYIQDQAVESELWTESEVFGKSKEDQYFEWVEKYRPIQNHIDTNAPFEGTMFETFGKEAEFVRCYPKYGKIWTLIETDGLQYIAAGYHHANRLGYFITEFPWVDGTEKFYND